jgi:hypothetical protein
LIERWNGTNWSIVAHVDPAGAVSPVLNAVSCSTATTCFAVGNYTSGATQRTLVEEWSGTWTVAPSPNLPGTNRGNLAGVSCRATTCVAAGDAATPTVDDALIERRS